MWLTILEFRLTSWFDKYGAVPRVLFARDRRTQFEPGKSFSSFARLAGSPLDGEMKAGACAINWIEDESCTGTGHCFRETGGNLHNRRPEGIVV
jgi:hypothetical protein